MTQPYIDIGISNIVTAFDEITIGSKVLCKTTFLDIVAHVIDETDFENQKEPGQAVIDLPNTGPSSVLPYLSAGVAIRSDKDQPSDFVIREYREGCKMYLKRSVAVEQGRCPVSSCRAVVDTREAYLNDPDVIKDAEETARIKNSDYTHILVAVLASTGDKDSPLSPFRFVHNLAGGNNEALKYTADEIREMAKEIIEYSNTHIAVAD
jgi:hypothetical protein